MNGWVKLHRQSLDHWLYNESRPHTRREAWEDMLLLANHEDNKVMIHGELIECKTGQSVMSLKNWAKQFKWTIQQVRTFFDILKKDEMINTEGLRKTTRITICNYAYYQKEQQTDNKQGTSREQAGNKQGTTNKNEENEKEGKENIYTADFLKFWEAYPLKEGKKPSFVKWQKIKGKPDIDEILAKIEIQKKSEKWKKGFIPMPETYINQERWNDEIKKTGIIRPAFQQ